ncbi:MAG: carbamoyltransferase [Pseudomonadales bacterium]|nr:carbamoyltransferase [Pseudomonadales bacterium]
MIILGLSGALNHDASAALLVDGEIVAAAEEERFLRDKHAKNHMPLESARYCLQQAGIDAGDIDVVAFPYAPISLFSRARWHYARRYWYAPDRALDALINGNRRFRRNKQRVLSVGKELGIDWQNTEFAPVEHHLAHASSAYHLSGFEEKTAIMGVDGKGEYATTFFGFGQAGKIHRIKEFYDPDSLSGVYGALTEFLGFEMLDGEYKVMGMAPYGDASRFDLSRLIKTSKGSKGFRVDTRLVNTVGLRRYKEAGRGFYFSQKLLDWLGPRRSGDFADEPYIHYAASMQALFEEVCLKLMDDYLHEVLAETGLLAFAGGGALNVKLNQRIIAREDVKELFVQPASGDSGTSLGAATYIANERGESLRCMQHAYLGPSFDNKACESALAARSENIKWKKMQDIPAETATLLAAGNPVAWFQGRMEFGPRALGARSILGCPSIAGVADRINEQIKFRERWRPFCPSIQDSVASEIIQTDHPAPFMTITFDVAEEWKARIPEVVHEDGTARVQIVEQSSHPRYYALLDEVAALTGNAVVLNTSLNRRGEAVVCTPDDALNMFLGCDLEYLVMQDWVVTKGEAVSDDPA